MYILELSEHELEALKEMAAMWKYQRGSLIEDIRSYPKEIYEGKSSYNILMAGDRLYRKINLLKFIE